MKKVFMHCCCAPCTTGVMKALADVEHRVHWFFFNPFIQPYLEYKARRDSFVQFMKQCFTEYNVVDEYDIEKLMAYKASGLSRCHWCYEVRLRKTAGEARKAGFTHFSTTLLISPYQQHDVIKELGERIGKELGIEFYYQDFRPFFRETKVQAIENNLYRQKYCGCIFSEYERFRA